jgi:hypothetical protein
LGSGECTACHVWRFRILDQNGKALDGSGLKSLVIELPDGKKVNAQYGPHPGPANLPWLAPDITAAIVNGRHPPELNAMTLMRLTPRLSIDWAQQRKLLGFR